MDAHLFRLFMDHANSFLLDARIEKIQEPARDHLTITLHGAGKKRHLCFRFGRKDPFCFFTGIRPEAMATPAAHVMRLRKYFINRRIGAVVSQPWSRKLWLMAQGALEPREAKVAWLCLDLSRGPQICFLDADQIPENEDAAWPDRGRIADALLDWPDWPCLTPPLRKTLAGMEDADQAALLADLRAGGGDVFIYEDSEGLTRKISAWPLLPAQAGNLKEIINGDILAAFEKAGHELVLRQIHELREKNRQAQESRRHKRLCKTLEKIRQDEQRLLAMAAKDKEARLLAENLWRLSKTDKLDQIDLPGGAKINLDKRFSIAENMERMFHAAKRGKRGLRMLEDRRENLEKQLRTWGGQEDAPRNGPGRQSGKPAPKVGMLGKHIQGFASSDGFQILRGRDARGNELARRQASGHDLWVHVKEGPGAHVIIRRPHGGVEPPLRTLEEAGSLAANKSWLNEAGEAEIMFAEVRHVKPVKSGPPGKVSIDKLYRTLVAAVDKSLENRLLNGEGND